jgi:hypothetical protein
LQIHFPFISLNFHWSKTFTQPAARPEPSRTVHSGSPMDHPVCPVSSCTTNSSSGNSGWPRADSEPTWPLARPAPRLLTGEVDANLCRAAVAASATTSYFTGAPPTLLRQVVTGGPGHTPCGMCFWLLLISSFSENISVLLAAAVVAPSNSYRCWDGNSP